MSINVPVDKEGSKHLQEDNIKDIQLGLSVQALRQITFQTGRVPKIT